MALADAAETSANDVDNDNQFSRLDPRRFTPNLHAQLVGEILRLRESSESKSKLILGLEEQLSLAERENKDLERLAQAAQLECRGLRRQLQLSEGGSDSALEQLQQERDSLTQVVDELRKRADALQSKLKTRDTDVERINALWESDRRSWNDHRRVADHKSHVAESRIKLLADELEALYIQRADSSQTSEIGHKRQHSRDGRISPDLNSPAWIQSDRQTVGYNTGENHKNLSLDKSSVQAVAQATLQSLAEELETDLHTDDSDDYESENALPEEQVERTNTYSSQLSPEAAKARRVLGLDMLEEGVLISQGVKVDAEDPKILQGRLLITEACRPTQSSEFLGYQDRSTQWTPPASSTEKPRSLKESVETSLRSEWLLREDDSHAAIVRPTESFNRERNTCAQCCRLSEPTMTQGCQTDESSFGPLHLLVKTFIEQPKNARDTRIQDVSTQTLGLYASSDDARHHSHIESDPKIPKIYIRRPTDAGSSEGHGSAQISRTPDCYRNASVQTSAKKLKEDDEHAFLSSNSSPSRAVDELVIGTTNQYRKPREPTSGTSRILHSEYNQSVRSVGYDIQENDSHSESNPLSCCSSMNGHSADTNTLQKLPQSATASWQTIETSDAENSRPTTSSSSLNGSASGRVPPSVKDLPLLNRLEVRSSQRSGQRSETQQRPEPAKRGQQLERSQYLDDAPYAENVIEQLPVDTDDRPSQTSMLDKTTSSTATGNGESSLEPPFPVPNRSSSKRLQYDLDSSTHSEGMVTFLGGGVYGTKLVDGATSLKHRPRNLATQDLSDPTLAAYDEPRKGFKGRNAPRSKINGNGKGRRETQSTAASMAKDENTKETDSGGLSHIQSSNVGSIRGSFVTDSVNVVDAIAQTMVGEWMWKYIRKRKSFGLPETPITEFELGKNSDLNAARHQRWVWVAPYERAVMWSSKQPTSGAALMGKNGRKLVIQSVLDVRDETPLPRNAGSDTFFGRSILILTAQRALKFTAKSLEKHYMWLTALSFLSHSNVLPSRIEACIGRPGFESANMDLVTPAALDKRASNVSLRECPRRDSIRLAKSRSAQGLGRPVDHQTSKAKSSWAPDRVARPVSKSVYPPEYSSDTEGVAEPPLVPRFANHSRKKSASGFKGHKSRSLKNVTENWKAPSKSSPSNPQLADDVTGIFGKRAGRTADGAGSSLRQFGLQAIHNNNKSNYAGGSRQREEMKELSPHDSHVSLHRDSNIGITSDNFFEAIGTVRMEAFVQGLDDVSNNGLRVSVEPAQMTTEIRDDEATSTKEQSLTAIMNQRSLRKVSNPNLRSNSSMISTSISDTRKDFHVRK